MAIKNFYAVLGVGSTASQEEIKLAYRKLAKRFHPDRNPGDKQNEERFKEISEAYNVLSGEESRKKYDLKFHYTSNSRSEKKYNPGATQREQPKFRVKKERPPTAAEKRATRWIFGTVVAFVITIIVMIVLNPEDNENSKMKQLVYNQDLIDQVPVKKTEPPPIMDADSPYDDIFGQGISIDEARNTIMVVNSEASEVVVCLVQKDPPYKTIRNEYFGPGLTYRIVGIPNGTYYLKTYFGKKWNPNKKLAGGKVKGGFDEEFGFFKSNKKENLFVIDQHRVGENLVYSNYEADLKNILDDKSRKISAEEFFK